MVPNYRSSSAAWGGPEACGHRGNVTDAIKRILVADMARRRSTNRLSMLASPRLTRFDFSWVLVIVDSRQCCSQVKDDFDMAFQAINIRRQIPIAHRASFGGSLALLLV